MKTTYFITALAMVLAVSISYSASSQQKDYSVITFLQEDSSISIARSTDSVVLGRKEFSILFYSKRYDSEKELYHALQVAVLTDPADTLMLATGKNVNDVPYFEASTGMAPGANGLYDAIVPGNTVHHYLYYEDEAERRVSRISIAYDLLELEWRIHRVFLDDRDVEFSDLEIPALYFVFFADRNLNETIDAQELKIVKVMFR